MRPLFLLALPLSLALAACGRAPTETEAVSPSATATAGSAEPTDEATPAPAPSLGSASGVPEEPAASAEPTQDLEPGPWRDLMLRGHPLAALTGFDGGYLAFVNVENEQDRGQIELWSIAANGRIRTSFGQDGRTVLAVGRKADGPQPFLYGAAKHEGTVLAAIATEQQEDELFIERILPDGSIDADFRTRQGGGFTIWGDRQVPTSVNSNLAVLPDGSARLCVNEHDWLDDERGVKSWTGIFGLDPTGRPDAQLGSDGYRPRILEDIACGAIAATPAGRTIVASGINPYDEQATPRLFGFDANGRRAGGSTVDRLGPDGAVSELRVASDGTIYATGVVRREPEGDELSGEVPWTYIVARADASGRWDRSFGEEGRVTIPNDHRGWPEISNDRAYVPHEHPDRDRPFEERLGVGVFDASGQRAFVVTGGGAMRIFVEGRDLVVFGSRYGERGAWLQRFPLG